MIENMIETMKELLNIRDISKEVILEFYLENAKESIKSYLNCDEDEMGKYQNQVINLAIHYYKNKDKLGKIQISQGSRSETIERGIPKEIIQSLPMPRVQIIG